MASVKEKNDSDTCHNGKEDFILECHNKDIAVGGGSDSTPNTARKAGGL